MIRVQQPRFVVVVAALALFGGCKDKPKADLAPTASALEATAAPEKAVAFAVDTPSSKVTFLMDSPLEKIDGDASGGLQGDLFLSLDDIAKSTALVKLDLQKLVLYQQKLDKDAFGERKKSDLQNSHAREWLQLVPHEGEVTQAQADANRWVEFKIDKVENASLSNVAGASGAERKLTATISGEFRLHGRKNRKSATVEITVGYAGDRPQSVHVKTTAPLKIGLEEYEVNPRDAGGKFVKSLSEALGDNLKGKVAKEAPVEIDFTAKVK